MASGDIVNLDPHALSSTIEFLTAMVTPTLLISATGSLVLSTSARLGRVVDRTRELEKRLSELIITDDKANIPLYELRLETIVKLLDKVTSRARLLQRAMGTFYYGLGCFILTSVTIAIAAFFSTYRWIPIPIGVVGICCLFWGSLLMLRETRMATATVNAEMDFTWALARKVAPREIMDRYTYNVHGRRRIRAKIPETFSGEPTDGES